MCGSFGRIIEIEGGVGIAGMPKLTKRFQQTLGIVVLVWLVVGKLPLIENVETYETVSTERGGKMEDETLRKVRREKNPDLYEEFERLIREGDFDFSQIPEPEEGTMAYECRRLMLLAARAPGGETADTPAVLYFKENIKETILFQFDFPDEGGGLQVDVFKDGSLSKFVWGRVMFARQVKLFDDVPWSVRVFDPKRMFRD